METFGTHFWFPRDGDAQVPGPSESSPEINAETAIRDDFASRKARAYKKAPSPRQKFVHFGPVTEIDQQTWKRLSIGKVGPREHVEVTSHGSQSQASSGSPCSPDTSSLKHDQMLSPPNDCRYYDYFFALPLQGGLHGSRCCFLSKCVYLFSYLFICE